MLRNRHSLGLLPCPENDPFSGIPSLSSRILVLSLLSWQCMPSPNLVFRILALGFLRSKWEPSSRPLLPLMPAGASAAHGTRRKKTLLLFLFPETTDLVSFGI